MNRLLTRLRYVCLGVFAVACVAVYAYQFGWVAPRQHCEALHRWWSPHDRECGVPVSLSKFTGRPNGMRLPLPPPSQPVR